jgi:hypothetical protein
LQYCSLNSGPTPWATPPALFCDGFFEIGSHKLFSLGWLQTTILMITASWVARITGMNHWYLATHNFYHLCDPHPWHSCPVAADQTIRCRGSLSFALDFCPDLNLHTCTCMERIAGLWTASGHVKSNKCLGWSRSWVHLLEMTGQNKKLCGGPGQVRSILLLCQRLKCIWEDSKRPRLLPSVTENTLELSLVGMA